jgi:hypothetical protein
MRQRRSVAALAVMLAFGTALPVQALLRRRSVWLDQTMLDWDIQALVRRDGRTALTAASVAAAWAARDVANDALLVAGLSAHRGLNEFWEASVLPFPPTSVANAQRYLTSGLGHFETLVQNALVTDNIAPRMTLAAWLTQVCRSWCAEASGAWSCCS